MTKEEYTAIIASIEQQMNVLNEKRSKTEQDYIASNREFANGDKVRIDKFNSAGELYDSEYGFVIDYEVSPFGDLCPKLAAAKLDGTMHRHKYIYLPMYRGNYKLTKVEP